MRAQLTTDIMIVGAGPVGMMCAYLGHLCGLRTVIVDKSPTPLVVGRADALNARTLQLFELAKLFEELYPIGKTCNTSSVWLNGRFVSRDSTWWDNLEGCEHKHFLMLGQHYVEELLDQKLTALEAGVVRSTTVTDIQVSGNRCYTSLSNGDVVESRYLIGADGSRSLVRELFNVAFEITRPQIIWTVIDGVIDSDFPKAPEIITFQGDTSDVAWIPREKDIDRFYVRMDVKDFKLEEAVEKINRAMHPHTLRFKEVVWFSQFTVKESVAEKFKVNDHVFLAGDSCHIHSVNGGQGLNTGLADAFNLIWKFNMVINFGFSASILDTYEQERKPIANSVIGTSGELVRATKYSANGTHAQDYVKIVEKHAGNITGMGIRYGTDGLVGTRMFDMKIYKGEAQTRLYSVLDYAAFTLFVFTDSECAIAVPKFVRLIYVTTRKSESDYWTDDKTYANMAILVRPDSYIKSYISLEDHREGEVIVFDDLDLMVAV